MTTTLTSSQPCCVTSSHDALSTIEATASHAVSRWRAVSAFVRRHCQIV